MDEKEKQSEPQQPTINPMLVQTLIAIVSSAMLAAMGGLVTAGVLTQEQAQQTAYELAKIIVPAIIGLITVWYVTRKARFQQKMIVTAASAPAGTPVKEIVEAAKKGLVDPKISRDAAPPKLSRADITSVQPGDNNAA